MPNQSTFSQLQILIEKECSKASFACGGSITIKEDSTAKTKATAQSSVPINLFWASPKDEEIHRLTFPAQSTESSVSQLANDCTVASFGRGDQDVVDTDYRRAGKLDTTHFASNFHPTEFGILENIEQILLPAMGDKANDESHSRKLIADLYKLNVYSEPSGHFCNHVDTPRDTTQIGSLVVCLPSKFEGGNLLVRHGGQEINFDWSSKSASTVQWAAFYSDCEHEIKTVTKGHRITLTYNLHLVDMMGGAILSPRRIVDPDTLPPYKLIKSMVGKKDFMTEGGILGFFCSHAYAHTSGDAARRLPKNLKGADIIIYSIFQSLRYEVSIRPVLDEQVEFTYYKGRLVDAQMVSNMPRDMSGANGNRKRWENLRGRKSTKRQQRIADLVGTELHKEIVASASQVETDLEELLMIEEDWPNEPIEDIHWLTSAKHYDTALTYTAYGNEPSVGYKYSYAAILVTIPAWEKRQRQ